MKLCSINLSNPRQIEHNGNTLKTSIFKRAVAGSVSVGPNHLQNDSQADLENHGGEHKAIYAFSYNQYAYWQRQLNRNNLHFGQFGENLTISDLDEANLCIGDQLQIADCRLEITQPRIPCFKFAIALENKTMPQRFIQHAATGIYFRILRTGMIQAGDDVKIVYRDPKQLSVQTLFKAFSHKEFSHSQQVLNQALSINALSTEWRQHIEQRLALTISN